jgi:hypothetical protein
MEDVTGWYASDIRNGVYADDGKLYPMSGDFKHWLKHRSGRVVIQKEPLTDHNTNVLIMYPKTLVYFEQQEDLVDYLLTFDEMPKFSRSINAAAYYAHYVPLTITSATNSIVSTSEVSFNTRYGLTNSTMSMVSVNSTDRSNGSV